MAAFGSSVLDRGCESVRSILKSRLRRFGVPSKSPPQHMVAAVKRAIEKLLVVLPGFFSVSVDYSVGFLLLL